MSGSGQENPSGRLWDREPSLWDAAGTVTRSHPVPSTDPQPEGTWSGGTAVDLSTPKLRIGLWGPPQQLTLSLGKTDVWDRRRYFEPPITLAEIKNRIAKDDVPPMTWPDYYLSWGAYDFPCSKPVGQIIVRCPDLEGVEQPTAAIRCDDGTATVEMARGRTKARLTYLAMMPRNLIAIHGDFQGLESGLSLRLYRHRDINGRNTSTFGALCSGWNKWGSEGFTERPTLAPLQGYDYEKDKDPDHAPLDPPTSGRDGKIFWIRQRIPAEKTFPDGFEYVMAGMVVGSQVSVETAEGERGLGTMPYLNRAQQEYVAAKKRQWFAWPNYELIRNATGAAAFATLPVQQNLRFTFVISIVTSADVLNPLEEAKRRLRVAESKGFAGLVAENAAWYKALYHRREKGRIFQGNVEFAKTQAAEAFNSWTLAHHRVCSPDPYRYEMARKYTLLEQDWDPFHGMPAYDELYHTFVHVRNRSDRLSYYYGLVNFWLPACKKNAREVFGLPGAALLIGYLPPIIPDQYAHGTSTWEFCMEIPAQVLKCLWDCFDYGGDELFLSESVYPALRETAIFYAHYASLGDDGKYHVIPTVSAENWGWTRDFEKNRDSTSALCMFKWLLDRAAMAAEILGKDADLRERWREIAGNMAPYPTWATPEGPVFTDVLGQDPIGVKYRRFAGGYPCDPADEINLDSTTEQKEMMLRTARLLKGINVKRIPRLLAAEKGITSEQLINSRSGRIHLFPAVPDNATVGFRDMQARDGFEVSAECVEGKVTYVRIHSRRNITCQVMNPWPGKPVEARTEATQRKVSHTIDTHNGECIVFQAKKGEVYIIAPDVL